MTAVLQPCPRPPEVLAEAAMVPRAVTQAAPLAPRAPAATRPIDAPWRQWIAENRLRDCLPAAMQTTMVGAGIDPAEAAAAIAAMEQDPVFLAARRMQQLHRKLESVVANQQRLWEGAAGYAQVERRSDAVPLDELLQRHVWGSRPLVLAGAARDWPALARWSPRALQARFGDVEVEIQAERDADRHYERNKLQHRRTVRFGDFVDRVLASGASNNEYLTANNEALRQPALAPLLDDVGALHPVCDRTQLAAKSSFWLGPAGTVTPLHHDTVMLMHTQVVGKKRWRFISPLDTPRLYNHYEVYSPIDLDAPDVDRWPRFRGVTVLETVLEPGDTLFLPLGWWHQVRSLDVSVSFSHTNLAVPNRFTFDNPAIADW